MMTRSELERAAIELVESDMENIGMTEEDIMTEVKKATTEDLIKFLEN